MTPIDAEHLRLLKVFHYVLAGMTALGALFPVFHLLIGILILSGKFGMPGPQAPQEGIPEGFGWFFVVIAGGMMLLGLSLAGLLFAAARCLGARRRHTFCLVVAALSCLWVPLGTVLGVFTIVVLMRDPVRFAFDRPGAGGG